MCFKKLFGKPDPEPITGNKVALLFGINDYMGSANDLTGCLNDIDDVEKKLKAEFPEFQIYKFKDSEVTTQRFIAEVEKALQSTAEYIYLHYSGHGTNNGIDQALYLWNGPLWENAIRDLEDKTPDDKKVTAKFDSCFSGGLDDRKVNLIKNRFKNRFYPMPGIRTLYKPEREFAARDIHKWIYYAACGPGQTAADAWFGNRANGAFSYFDNRAYAPTTLNRNEIISDVKYLRDSNFEQIPELVGPEERINGLVLH